MATGEPFTCDPTLEDCATTSIFAPNTPINETAYIMTEVVFTVGLFAPIAWYFSRIAIQVSNGGSTLATDWLDITTLVFWIADLILFVTSFATWPFYWLESEQLDWVMAWMMVNWIADGMPALAIIFWVWFLIVAIGSGTGNPLEVTYISATEGWVSWAVYTVVAGGLYFMMFWFGADAVRFLRPNGGYELYYLWPTLIYELLVVVGAAADAPRALTGYDALFKTEDHSHSTVSTVEVEKIDITEPEPAPQPAPEPAPEPVSDPEPADTTPFVDVDDVIDAADDATSSLIATF